MRRPRRQVHPAKPKIGIRASAPNEIWNSDATVIRLLDVTRAYLHTVIDNFSRRVLAWKVSERIDPANTVATLSESARSMALAGTQPTVLADAGVEDVNTGIDELIDEGVLQRVLAQREITFSSSMIESWWRSLEHQWLYLNRLNTVASLGRLVSFYVLEHNTRLPHSAFRGQTPDQLYFGTGTHVPPGLVLRRRAARTVRLEANRAVSCKDLQTREGGQVSAGGRPKPRPLRAMADIRGKAPACRERSQGGQSPLHQAFKSAERFDSQGEDLFFHRLSGIAAARNKGPLNDARAHCQCHVRIPRVGRRSFDRRQECQ